MKDSERTAETFFQVFCSLTLSFMHQYESKFNCLYAGDLKIEFYDVVIMRAKPKSGKKSTIVTTNLGFDRWQEIFTDKIIAAALVDRLAFRSYIIDMNGPSYRLRATENWLNSRKEKSTEAKS